MYGNFVGLVSGLVIIGSTMAQADENLAEDFHKSPETRWDYVADTVMGGVSSGQVQFSSEGEVTFARLTGTVSTENNGGFIQFRRKLPDRTDAGVLGVRLLVRGNGEQYFVHLRTRGTVLPWQYYQAEFATSDEWNKVSLPLSDFKASDAMLRAIPVADDIVSIGAVAYGRDHKAHVDVSEVGFY